VCAVTSQIKADVLLLFAPFVQLSFMEAFAATGQLVGVCSAVGVFGVGTTTQAAAVGALKSAPEALSEYLTLVPVPLYALTNHVYECPATRPVVTFMETAVPGVEGIGLL
jgi:hypothetical protein